MKGVGFINELKSASDVEFFDLFLLQLIVGLCFKGHKHEVIFSSVAFIFILSNT